MSTMAVESPPLPGCPRACSATRPATDVGRRRQRFALADPARPRRGRRACRRPRSPTAPPSRPTARRHGEADRRRRPTTTGTTDVDGTGTPDAALAALVVPTPLAAAGPGRRRQATAGDRETVDGRRPPSDADRASGADAGTAPSVRDGPPRPPTDAAAPPAPAARPRTTPQAQHARPTPTAAGAVAGSPRQTAPGRTHRRPPPQVEPPWPPVVAPADAAGTPAPRPVAAPGHPRGDQAVQQRRRRAPGDPRAEPGGARRGPVVLTVRNGDVHVRLAAGSEARAGARRASPPT